MKGYNQFVSEDVGASWSLSTEEHNVHRGAKTVAGFGYSMHRDAEWKKLSNACERVTAAG